MNCLLEFRVSEVAIRKMDHILKNLVHNPMSTESSFKNLHISENIDVL